MPQAELRGGCGTNDVETGSERRRLPPRPKSEPACHPLFLP